MKWRLHYLKKKNKNITTNTYMEKTALFRYAHGDRKKKPHDFVLLYIEAKLLQLRRQNIQWNQKLKEANNSKYLDQQNQIQ